MAKLLQELGKITYGTQGKTRQIVKLLCHGCNTQYSISKYDYYKNTDCMCKTCTNIKMSQDNLKKAAARFQTNGNIAFDNKYDYSVADYKGAHIPLVIICPFHGEFTIRPVNHNNGQGCAKCGQEMRANSLANKSAITFIDKVSKVHKYIYNYTKTKYTRSRNKITITCKQHGDFEQVASSHLNGSGCPKCKSQSDKDSIYIWNVVGTSIYKIGVTSVRLATKRIKYVAQQLGKGYIINLIHHTSNAALLEKQLLNKYVQCPLTIPDICGRTEFRVLTKDELSQAISIINKGK